ncbi:hypothetical protein C8A03DRAFT_38875 [Achaetomium macrosporum]|uniref:Uncharacterized protein n=1 Tax=Achaetomium macrosporum TaxID=79813 RepID=A0AAN7H6W9_9PEZI|nr:hypothetical protein C8A03DRAFT_38875 [Achaetomium macrosporum]
MCRRVPGRHWGLLRHLDAFAGALAYLGHTLGDHHHGLPQKIFGEAVAWSCGDPLTVSPGGLARPSWSWTGWKFTAKDIYLRIPPGQPLITFYRADQLEQPVWGPGPTDNYHYLAPNPKDFTPPTPAEAAREISLVEKSADSASDPYFPAGRVAEIRRRMATALPEVELLRRHLLVFAASSASLRMTISNQKCKHSHTETACWVPPPLGFLLHVLVTTENFDDFQTFVWAVSVL